MRREVKFWNRILSLTTRLLLIPSLIFLVSCSSSSSQDAAPSTDAPDVLSQWKSDCRSNGESSACEAWVSNHELQDVIWDGINAPSNSSLTADLIPDDRYSANKGVFGRLFCSREIRICAATVSLENTSTQPINGILGFDLATSAGVFAADRSYSLTAPINPSAKVNQSFGVNTGSKIPSIYFVRVFLNNEYIARIHLCEKVNYLKSEEKISDEYIVYENCLRLNGYDFKKGRFVRDQS